MDGEKEIADIAKGLGLCRTFNPDGSKKELDLRHGDNSVIYRYEKPRKSCLFSRHFFQILSEVARKPLGLCVNY